MAIFGSLGRRLWMRMRQAQTDRDLCDEMRLHVALIEQRQRAAGVSPAEARTTARRQFGSALRITEASRDARGWRWLDDLLQDLRYAVRSLVTHKAFAATAIATLALGIGANTAIFSVVNGVILRPLPFADPDRLVQVYGTPAARGQAVDGLEDYRRESTSFDFLVGYEVSARYLLGPSGTDRVMTVNAERGFFPMLGVAPIAGRTFGSDDPATVAVVSEGFWKARLGGDRSAIGRLVTLDGEPFTVIGVMPDSFQFPYAAGSSLHGAASEARTDLWVPLDPPADPALRARARYGSVTGRLHAQVLLARADSELAVISSRREAQSPDPYGPRGVRLAPLADTVVTPSIRRPLLVLLGAAGIVLALACANVTNLSLVGTTLRRREVAVRVALGAGPHRLIRQFLTESLLLSLAGGLVGLGLAWWGTKLLVLMAGVWLPRVHEVGFDGHVFLFLLAACVVTGAAFGVAPAMLALRTDPHSVLQSSAGHNTMGVGLRRLRDGLVAAEVALAFVLAVGGVLLVRELVRLQRTDTGMVSQNVLTLHLGQRIGHLGVPRRGAPPAETIRQFYDIADRVADLPGVQAAGFTQVLPLQNWGWSANAADFTVRGRPPAPSPPAGFQLCFVTPGYFQALGIPITRGRAFTARDNADSPPVILINETLARAYFGNDDPSGAETPRGTIVGVVADVRQVGLDRSPEPELYYPIAQSWSQLLDLGMTLVVRTDDRPDRSINAIRAAIHDVSPNQAIFNVKTMDDVIGESLSDFTLYLWLMAGFAALSLALTGTYGVMSHVATSRTREFAIRVALGASRGRVTALVAGQAIRVTALGLVGGLAGALAAAPLLQNLPIGVRPPDAATLVPVALVIAAVGMAAGLAPRLRTAGVNPMRALRDE